MHVVDWYGRKEGEVLLPGVDCKSNPYEAVEGADCLLILTEWNHFRTLDLQRLAAAMATPQTADLRNIYSRENVLQAGFFAYVGVGLGQVGSHEIQVNSASQ